MTAIPFGERPSSQLSSAAPPNPPNGRPYTVDNLERAVAHLLRHGVLSHAFGQHLEYKVRTTIATHQTWQYRCCVLRHGKAMKRAFVPITVDGTPQKQHVRTEPGGTEAMRRSFAKEAVDVHLTRCAALQEYLVLAAIYSQPALESKRPYTLLALLIGAAFLAAYGFWTHAIRTDSGQLPGGPTPPVQGAPSPVIDRRPTRAPLSAPLPASSGTASRSIMNEQADTSHTSRFAETPKAVRLIDLLSLEDPPDRADHAPRAPVPRGAAESTAVDVQPGDMLLLSGWIHRASRTPDNTYRLQMSTSPRVGVPGVIAVVPPPDQAGGSPAVRAQLQTVRAFITRRLLRQQEPSLRGSVLQRPIFVQLTGQLSYLDASFGGPSQGKGAWDATARWEVRPVLEVRIATPQAPSARSRPK